MTLLLLVMIAVAALQALWFNLAESGVGWAARILEASAWADRFLQRGTLCLAFLGASLATHQGKHFSIDLVTRVVPERWARVMLRAVALGASIVSLALAVVFFEASLASDARALLIVGSMNFRKAGLPFFRSMKTKRPASFSLR